MLNKRNEFKSSCKINLYVSKIHGTPYTWNNPFLLSLTLLDKNQVIILQYFPTSTQ